MTDAKLSHGPLGRTIRTLALQDWLIFCYFFAFLFALIIGNGPGRPACIVRVLVDLLVLVVGLVLTRGELLRAGSNISGLVYRLTLFSTVLSSYFQLRAILPAVSTRAYDAQIFAFDLTMFHYEPALAWDKYITPVTTEWFSFFYFSHFFILAVHILPFMLVARDTKLLSEFSLGIFGVFCVAHVIYMIVPGYGPYRHLAHALQGNLDATGGVFWRLVADAVKVGGALKDIFPSLHTGGPSFIAIFSFRHRDSIPFKFTWPVTAFFASNIIIATMFLRWHYLIDIVAGLALAIASNVVIGRLSPWESERRESRNLPPVFSTLRCNNGSN